MQVFVACIRTHNRGELAWRGGGPRMTRGLRSTITTEKCALGTDMEDLLQWNG